VVVALVEGQSVADAGVAAHIPVPNAVRRRDIRWAVGRKRGGAAKVGEVDGGRADRVNKEPLDSPVHRRGRVWDQDTADRGAGKRRLAVGDVGTTRIERQVNLVHVIPSRNRRRGHCTGEEEGKEEEKRGRRAAGCAVDCGDASTSRPSPSPAGHSCFCGDVFAVKKKEFYALSV
jgi:hypothetical protein